MKHKSWTRWAKDPVAMLNDYMTAQNEEGEFWMILRAQGACIESTQQPWQKECTTTKCGHQATLALVEKSTVSPLPSIVTSESTKLDSIQLIVYPD